MPTLPDELPDEPPVRLPVDVFAKGGTEWCLLPVEANGQPGFAAYGRVDGGYELRTLQIFTVTADGISRNSVFRDFDVFASFGLVTALDADQVPLSDLGGDHDTR